MSDNEIKVYNTIAKQYKDYKKGFYPEECLYEFLSYLSPKSSILDLGCGPGQASKFFYDAKHSVTCIDFSEEMLKIAKKEMPNAKFFLWDIRNINQLIRNDSFDGVWACASLLHMSKNEVPYVFNQIHDVLKDNGIFYVSVKQGEGEKDIIDKRYNNISRHFSYFKFMELADLLVNSKFKPIYSSSNEAKYETPTGKTWLNFIVRK